MSTVLVCGSRGFSSHQVMLDALMDHADGFDSVVTGSGPGADEVCRELCQWMGIVPTMLNKAAVCIPPGVTLVLAFWDGQSPGTRELIRRAQRAGVTTRIFYYR